MNELFIKLLCSPVETSSKQNKRVGNKRVKLGAGRIWKEVRHHYQQAIEWKNKGH